MDMQSAIRAVMNRDDLSSEDMTSVMRMIMTGESSQAQIGGFLVGLHMKGESVTEIAAAASVMRELATKVEINADYLVDTCGTGGDASGTFNISTASALVAAGAGAHVAKHGNRSVSGKTGSADVLEALGVNLDLTPEQVAQCVAQAGVGFMFAPKHHGAMKHAIGPRKEMGVRTMFNLLGPLTNPACAPNQVIGVFSDFWLVPLARVLKHLGSRHVLLVHSEDGLDEISIAAPTKVAQMRDGQESVFTIEPEDFAISRQSLTAIQVESADASRDIILSVLDGKPGPAADIVALNAGAAIFSSGLADSLADGVHRAQQSMADGSAGAALDKLVEVSQTAAR